MVVYSSTSSGEKPSLGKRIQQSHETVEDFAKALKESAEHSGEENKDEQLTEHFVENMSLSSIFKMWSKSLDLGWLDYKTTVTCASAMEHGAKYGAKRDSPSVVIENCNTAHLNGKGNYYDYKGGSDKPESYTLNSDDTSRIDEILNRMFIDGKSKDVRDEIDNLDRQFPRGVYKCKGCGEEITRTENEATVPGYPRYAVKKNPSGYVFKTMTCSSMKRYKEVSKRTTQYTWFKGYSWTICRCINCEKHVGWKYYSESKEEKLDTFFCLVLDSVDVSELPPL